MASWPSMAAPADEVLMQREACVKSVPPIFMQLNCFLVTTMPAMVAPAAEASKRVIPVFCLQSRA
eukprot:1160256-Pelagomonas_calceolata.AAC.9